MGPRRWRLESVSRVAAMAYGWHPTPSTRHAVIGQSTSVRSRAAGSHEVEFDDFLLGALAESKVDNPDWEDALEGQEPFAGGAAPQDDGPDTQSFEKTSEKGDGDDMDDFD